MKISGYYKNLGYLDIPTTNLDLQDQYYKEKCKLASQEKQACAKIVH